MVEWSITAVLKTAVPRGAGGSNPSLSAQSPVNRKIYRTLAFYAFDSPPFFWSADFPLLNNQVSFLNLNVHLKFIFHDYLFRSYHLYKHF